MLLNGFGNRCLDEIGTVFVRLNVAGTDPTNALSKFTAKIEMKDGVPSITWNPALNGEGVREGARVYRVWGKANLDDSTWSEVETGEEGDYRFFRVTVEMP